jgi:hypothetical protein
MSFFIIIFVNQDASLSHSFHKNKPSGDSPQIDDIKIVIANLPWGKNTINYSGLNLLILQKVRSILKIGCPCAFIVPSDFEEDGMETHCGYKIEKVVNIGLEKIVFCYASSL